RRAFAHARRRVAEQLGEPARRDVALAEQLGRDATHARAVGAEVRDQQRHRARIGDFTGQRVFRALHAGRVAEPAQAAAALAPPEVAELIADQVADYGIGARQRVEQRRDARGIGAGAVAVAAQNSEPQRQDGKRVRHGSCPSAWAAAWRTFGSRDCSAACSACRAEGSAMLPSACVAVSRTSLFGSSTSRRSEGIAPTTERSPASRAARWRTSESVSVISLISVASAIGAFMSSSAPSADSRTSELGSLSASVTTAALLWSPRLPSARSADSRTSDD